MQHLGKSLVIGPGCAVIARDSIFILSDLKKLFILDSYKNILIHKKQNRGVRSQKSGVKIDFE